MKEIKVTTSVGDKKFKSEISYNENRVKLKDLQKMFEDVKPIELQEQRIHPEILKLINAK